MAEGVIVLFKRSQGHSGYSGGWGCATGGRVLKAKLFNNSENIQVPTRTNTHTT